MSYDTEHYYAVQTFLEDDELEKIWDIVEIAMNRQGYDVSNSELSIRLYDQELEENIEHDMEVAEVEKCIIETNGDYAECVDHLLETMEDSK